jgi:hypothetical protein
MSAGAFAVAVIWGMVSGFMIIRSLDRLAGIGFCLHALLMARWSRLARKPVLNQVNPGIILRLMFQVALLSALFGFLLYQGYGFTRREFRFDYGGWEAVLYAAVICATALSRLPATKRRLVHFWRMSHEVDYAQRRQRTLLLKS